jgi:putative transposase
MPDFERTNIRLPAPYYLGQRLYFLTLCFHDRRPYGKNASIARWLIDELRKHAHSCAFFVHAFCVMPDHMHFLVAGVSETSNVLKIVMKFKQDTAHAFAQKTNRVLWQFKFYDHILRGEDSAERVAWYIWSNPVRAGLCAIPTDYPFLGSFTRMSIQLLKRSQVTPWTPPWKEPPSNHYAAPQIPS